MGNYLKNILIVLFFVVFACSSFANNSIDKLQTTLIPDNTRSAIAPPVDNSIKKSKFEVGDCLKYLKDGESYWSHKETQVLKIEKIGEKNLKVRMFGFLKKTDKWLLSPAQSLEFNQQSLFIKTDCPSIDKRLSDKELEELTKDKN